MSKNGSHIMSSTISFIIGMVMGVILFIAAIAGTIIVIATGTTVGNLTKLAGVGTDIVGEDSDLSKKTLFEVGKDIIGIIDSIGTLTVQDLINYGINIPTEISGIDLSGLYEVPLNQLGNNLGKVLDNITLQDLGEFAGIDWQNDPAYSNLGIIQDNLTAPVVKALGNIMGSINADKMSLRALESNFGLSFGESALFNQIYDLPLSSFANVINALELRYVLDVDSDLFVKANEALPIYVVANNYIELTDANVASTDPLAETYIASVDASNKLVSKEMRYVKVTTTDADGNEVVSYKVNNAPWAEGFDAAADENTYYRHIEHALLTSSTVTTADTEYFIAPYFNIFESDGAATPTYSLVQADYVSLADVYTYDGATYTSLAAARGSATSVTFNPATTDYYYVDKGAAGYIADNSTSWTYVKGGTYGLSVGEVPTADSKLGNAPDKQHNYLMVYGGTSDKAIQAIATTTVSGLNNVTGKLMSLPLKDLITIDDTSTRILKTLKDTPMNELSAAIDNLALKNVISINFDSYAEDPNGLYVYVKGTPVVEATPADGDGYYTLFNAAAHATVVHRYSKTSVNGYARATEFDGSTTYFSDTIGTIAAVAPTASTDFVADTYYVQVSSAIMQRLANDTVDSLGNAFDTVLLSDVIEVDGDVFAAVDAAYITAHTIDADGNTDEDFFRYDDGVYLSTDKTYRDAHTSETYYRIASVGNTSAVLKRMAYIQVQHMGSKMDLVINDLLFTDVIDVNPNDVVKAYVSGDKKYLVEYTEYDAVTNEYYTYVYDDKGKYVKSNETYEAIAPTAASTAYFKYSSVAASTLQGVEDTWESGPLGQISLASTLSSYYYCDTRTGEYHSATAIATYLLNQAVHVGTTDASGTAAAGALSSSGRPLLFVREAATEGETGAIAYNIYTDEADYFVKLGGSYVNYSPSDISHAGEAIYLHRHGVLTTFYYNEITSGDIAPFYSKVLCDYIYVEATDGDYVYFNKNYVAYDAATHDGLQRYSRVMGYLASYEQIHADGGTDVTSTEVESVVVKSSSVLKTFADKKVRIGNLDSLLHTFTLGDMMTIEPGNMLESLKGSTLDNISTDLRNKLKGMTVGDMMGWGNITAATDVKALLENVLLEDLFNALTYDATTGSLTVDMTKLYRTTNRL